ncbi:uncharacterized protein [Atheta coriaria]|uniref:uncharacterized protein isoform X1 n=1 Tax=Dalotia coriaria TaxID=877792 RepID=UPI0031F35154
MPLELTRCKKLKCLPLAQLRMTFAVAETYLRRVEIASMCSGRLLLRKMLENVKLFSRMSDVLDFRLCRAHMLLLLAVDVSKTTVACYHICLCVLLRAMLPEANSTLHAADINGDIR